MTRTPTLQDIRRNVATPWNLPQAPEGTIHPEPVRRALAHAYADLIHIYRSERMKPGRNPWLPGFVQGLAEE